MINTGSVRHFLPLIIHITLIVIEVLYISLAVPLGSIQELPAESCAEIKASEGSKVSVDSKHWIYLGRVRLTVFRNRNTWNRS